MIELRVASLNTRCLAPCVRSSAWQPGRVVWPIIGIMAESHRRGTRWDLNVGDFAGVYSAVQCREECSSHYNRPE